MSDNIMVIEKVGCEDCLSCCFHNKRLECCELKDGCFYGHFKDFFYCANSSNPGKFLLKELDGNKCVPSKSSTAFKKVDNDEHSCDGCIFYRSFCGCILKHEGYGWAGEESDVWVCGDSYKFVEVHLYKEVVE